MRALHKTAIAAVIATAMTASAVGGPLPTSVAALNNVGTADIVQARWGGWGWGYRGLGLGGSATGPVVGSYGDGYYPYASGYYPYYNTYYLYYAYYGQPYDPPYDGGQYLHYGPGYWRGSYWAHRAWHY